MVPLVNWEGSCSTLSAMIEVQRGHRGVASVSRRLTKGVLAAVFGSGSKWRMGDWLCERGRGIPSEASFTQHLQEKSFLRGLGMHQASCRALSASPVIRSVSGAAPGPLLLAGLHSLDPETQ